MGGPLPDGDPAPADGRLPDSARLKAESRAFGVYVHVPFCRVRCGYCDFNTYTASELRGSKRSDYASEARAEIRFAADALRRSDVRARRVSTVFFGGGTPTMLPASDLAVMLGEIRSTFGIEAGAEITTEANPDSVDGRYLESLVRAGFTRISFGMQSAVPSVLRTLDRTHAPERVPEVVALAKGVGLDVSVDLIYGAPGETLEQWRTSVDAALELEPNHVSAYALIVEQGTKLARQIRSGALDAPDDDLEVDKYELANAAFEAAGLQWYELSNWARAGYASVHNENYWLNEDWWGIGPGAHSHVGDVRWWNVKHPAAYAAKIAEGVSPAAARELLDDDTQYEERVLLETRLAQGMAIEDLRPASRRAIDGLVSDELIVPPNSVSERVVLTVRGRMLADTVTRRLL